jgi:hypothetical protein
MKLGLRTVVYDDTIPDIDDELLGDRKEFSEGGAANIKLKSFVDNFSPIEKEAIETAKEYKDKLGANADPKTFSKLYPKQTKTLVNISSKAAKVGLLGLKGLQEIVVGTGPWGIFLTGAIQLPITIYEASQGKRSSEMLNTATFGLLGQSQEDILKEIGGEDAVKGLEYEKKLDKLADLEKQFEAVEENMRFTSPEDMSTFDEDKIQKQIKNRKKSIANEYYDIENSIKDSDLESQKKLDDIIRRKLSTEEGARLKIGTMEAYGKPIDTLEIPEPNAFEKEITEEKEKQKLREQTYASPPVRQEIIGESIDDILNRNYGYAIGGRVELKKGSKDKDSPVIPISPLTDLPQNESRRDFLKGMGAVGLGAVALGTGAFKLAKSLKTKEALSLLGKEAVGQPEWFAPLVDKIILKGIRLEKDGKKLDSYVLQEGDKTLTLTKLPYGAPQIGGKRQYDTINIDVKGGGAYDDTFTLRYNNSIGKNMYGKSTEFRDFSIIESRPRYQVSGMDESGFDYDLEPMEEYFSGKDLLKLEKNATGILSDVEGLEKIATGKIKDPKLAKTRAQVRDKLSKKPADDRIIENYDYEYDIEIPHEYND